MPITFLIIGECIDFITSSKKLPLKIWGYALVSLFIFSPLTLYFNELCNSMKKEDIKTCLKYINKNKRPNDVIFLQHFLQFYSF